MKPGTTSVYAFVGWISSICLYLIFLVWALAPESFLHEVLGVTYYPSRYYAVALPAYFLVVLVLICMAYMGLNMLNTLEPEEYGTIRDDYSLRHVAPPCFIQCSTKLSASLPDVGDMDPCEASLLLLTSRRQAAQDRRRL